MRLTTTTRLILLCGIIISGTVAATGQGKKKYDFALAVKIDSLAAADQKWRGMLRHFENSAGKDSTLYFYITDHLNSTDSSNLLRLKEIISRSGFPGYDQVGEQSSDNFWLLLQHCDRDVFFQDTVLTLMKPEVDRSNANGINYAYLLDRIKVNRSQPQVYGTQMQLNSDSSSYEPQPLTDPGNVNSRRASVGMPPIETYIEQMNKRYFGTLKK